MIPTLRELNRLLPNLTCKSTYQTKSKIREKSKKVLKRSSTNYSSPYQEPQIRPKSPIKNNKKSENFSVGPNFMLYEQYRDPNYIVPNEHFRWFETLHKSMINLGNKELIDYSCNALKNKEHILKYFKCYTKLHDQLQNNDLSMANSQCQCDVDPQTSDTQTQIIVKTIVRDLIDNRSGYSNIRPCCNLQGCIDDFYRYLKLYEEQKSIKNEQKTKYFENATCFSPFKIDYEKVFKCEKLGRNAESSKQFLQLDNDK